MKDKILTLMIGILIGAIIMACIFLVYTKKHPREEVNNENSNIQQENFEPNQDFRQGGDMQFKGIPDGKFNPGNGTEDDENRPTPPDGDFNKQFPEGEAPNENFGGQRPEVEQNQNNQ